MSIGEGLGEELGKELGAGLGDGLGDGLAANQRSSSFVILIFHVNKKYANYY